MDKTISVDTNSKEKAIKEAEKYYEYTDADLEKWDHRYVSYKENKTIKRMAENYAKEFATEQKNNSELNEEYISDYILHALADDTVAMYVINETINLLKNKYGLDFNHNLSI